MNVWSCGRYSYQLAHWLYHFSKIIVAKYFDGIPAVFSWFFSLAAGRKPDGQLGSSCYIVWKRRTGQWDGFAVFACWITFLVWFCDILTTLMIFGASLLNNINRMLSSWLCYSDLAVFPCLKVLSVFGTTFGGNNINCNFKKDCLQEFPLPLYTALPHPVTEVLLWGTLYSSLPECFISESRIVQHSANHWRNLHLPSVYPAYLLSLTSPQTTCWRNSVR